MSSMLVIIVFFFSLNKSTLCLDCPLSLPILLTLKLLDQVGWSNCFRNPLIFYWHLIKFLSLTFVPALHTGICQMCRDEKGVRVWISECNVANTFLDSLTKCAITPVFKQQRLPHLQYAWLDAAFQWCNLNKYLNGMIFNNNYFLISLKKIYFLELPRKKKKNNNKTNMTYGFKFAFLKTTLSQLAICNRQLSAAVFRRSHSTVHLVLLLTLFVLWMFHRRERQNTLGITL